MTIANPLDFSGNQHPPTVTRTSANPTQLPSGNTPHPDYRPVMALTDLREQIVTSFILEAEFDYDFDAEWDYRPYAERYADAILPLVSAAITEAKAEALEEAATNLSNRYGDREFVFARAAEYRTPKERP